MSVRTAARRTRRGSASAGSAARRSRPAAGAGGPKDGVDRLLRPHGLDRRSASRSTPRRCARCIGRYFDEMRAVLERHGGTVEKYIGDAVMAVFGLPTVHEDDALRAVRAAADMQDGARAAERRARATAGASRSTNRTGVNTGEVVAGDPTLGQRLVTGDAVNVAARLEQAAPALEVLIGEPTYRLVRDAVEVEPVEPLELKGKAERVPAYRLVVGQAASRRLERRRDARCMVGRESSRSARAADARSHAAVAGRAADRSRPRRGRRRQVAADRRVRCAGRATRRTCCAAGASRTGAASRSGRSSRSSGRRPASTTTTSPGAVARRSTALAGEGGDGRRRARRRRRSGSSTASSRSRRSSGASRKLLERLRADAAARRRLRRHPLGRADVPRPHRAPRRGRAATRRSCSSARRARSCSSSGRPGPPDAARIDARARAARPRTSALRSSRTSSATPPSPRIAAGSSRRPRATRSSSSRCSRCSSTTACCARRTARWRPARDLAELADPADDPGAPRRAPRPALRAEERAVIEPASVVGLVFSGARGRGARPEPIRDRACRRTSTRSCRKQLVRQPSATRRGEQSFRFHHILDPRRRLRGAPQARRARRCTSGSSTGPSASTASATARSSTRRSSATTSSRRTATSPSSGRSTTHGARARRARRRAARVGRPARVRRAATCRPPRTSSGAPSSCCPTTTPTRLAASARPRRGADGDRRVRVGRAVPRRGRKAAAETGDERLARARRPQPSARSSATRAARRGLRARTCRRGERRCDPDLRAGRRTTAASPRRGGCS